MHHSLVAIAVAAIAGMSLDGSVGLSATAVWWWLAAALSAATGAHLGRRSREATVLLLVAAGLAGLLRSQLSDPLLDRRHYANAAQPLLPPLKLQVADDPETIVERSSFLAYVRSDATGASFAGLVRVSIRSPGAFRPAYGDLLLCRGELEAVPEPLAADPSPRLRTLRLKGVLGQVELRPGGFDRLERDTGNPVLGAVYELRHRFSEVLTATHEAKTTAFLRGMLLGERGALAPDTLSELRVTGTIHILSQSGQHIAILCLVCVFVFRLLPGGRRLSGPLTILVLALYALMTGGRPSVMRAAIMATCVLLGPLAGRKSSPFNGVALAALALLAYDPADLYSAGFQLTFAACLSILVLTPWLMQLLQGFPSYGTSLLSASTAAYLGTLPLMAYHFGTVSLVAPLANIFVMPLVAIIMPTGLAGLLLGMVNAQLAYVFAAANYGFVKVLLRGVGILAQCPFADVTVPAPWPSAILVYFFAIVILADYHNIARLIERRRPKGILSPASSDWSWILANRPMDPLMARLEELLEPVASQPPAEEQLAALRAQLGEELASRLDSVTLRYLAFASLTSQDSSPLGDSAGTVSVAAYLLAVERELDSRIFRFLRVPDAVARSEVARSYRRGHIGRPPRPAHDVLALPLQSEILWHYLLPTDGSKKNQQHALARELGERLAKPALYLEPSRLPLHLDRILKKYYLPLCDREPFDRARAQAAAREILGEPNHAFLREIVAAGSLARPED